MIDPRCPHCAEPLNADEYCPNGHGKADPPIEGHNPDQVDVPEDPPAATYVSALFGQSISPPLSLNPDKQAPVIGDTPIERLRSGLKVIQKVLNHTSTRPESRENKMEWIKTAVQDLLSGKAVKEPRRGF